LQVTDGSHREVGVLSLVGWFHAAGLMRTVAERAGAVVGADERSPTTTDQIQF
jgi:hypothetical protein